MVSPPRALPSDFATLLSEWVTARSLLVKQQLAWNRHNVTRM